MGGIDPWWTAAIALNFAGYALYLAGLRRRLVEPSRASWLIWSAATGVEAATYLAINPGAVQGSVILVSAVLCAGVTIGIWSRSAWTRPTATEALCVSACLASLALWLLFREAYWAHMLVVAAVPVSFLPTWASVMEDRTREVSPAWGLWTLGDLATLLVAARGGAGGGVAEFAYLFVELAAHASVWFLIGLPSINPLRSLGRRRGGLLVLDRYLPTANRFTVGATHLGKAVFAAVPLHEGERLIAFTGPRLAAARIPRRLRGAADRFVQVTPGEVMGPSGRLDDLVNHSCEPNAGLRFGPDGVVLVAIRDIAPGEEVTWDYSTTLTDAAWRMSCACGAPRCRGVVGAFDTLPAERQQYYRARNLVPPYLRRRDVVAAPTTGMTSRSA